MRGVSVWGVGGGRYLLYALVFITRQVSGPDECADEVFQVIAWSIAEPVDDVVEEGELNHSPPPPHRGVAALQKKVLC